ncbi:PTS system mannose-specific transporter subunit IID [Raoultella terrigena]|nr:PTS system mannose-specific transporter subunit IID [Raoultella terrigena]
MEERTLNRKDLRRCWRAWMMHNLSSMSFERLESFGFCLSMLPVAKKLYPDAAQRMENAAPPRLLLQHRAADRRDR